MDSCKWKEDSGVAETERLVFSNSKVAQGGRCVQLEPEETTLVQMFRKSTDHDAAMHAQDLCNFMKRLVLATPSETNMHELTGEVRAFKDTNEDKECRTKVYERHAHVPVK
jgi:hypothetical protein